MIDVNAVGKNLDLYNEVCRARQVHLGLGGQYIRRREIMVNLGFFIKSETLRLHTLVGISSCHFFLLFANDFRHIEGITHWR